MDEMYTPPEVAVMLKVHTKTLARWRREGDGPRFIKVEGNVRYLRADLDDYLEALTAVR